MKHNLNLDGNPKVDVHVHHDIPKQDLEDLLDKVALTAFKLIGAYMIADVIRHNLKK